MDAPMPLMSAAGLERVNVTHTKLFSDRAVKSLSSTRMTSGKELIASPGRYAEQNRARSGWRSGDGPATDWQGGACTTSTPGRATRGSRNPSGQTRSGGSEVGRLRRGGPAAAITRLEHPVVHR